MVKIALVLVMFAQFCIYSDGGKVKMKKIIWVHVIDACPGTNHNTTITGDFKYSGNGNALMTIVLDIYGSLPYLYFYVTLKKCPTKIQTGECQDLMAFPVGDQCIAENAYFVDLYHQFQPPIECPISGRFTAKDIKLNQDTYSAFFRGLEEDEWLHVYLSIYSDEKRTQEELCVRLILAIKKIRAGTKS